MMVGPPSLAGCAVSAERTIQKLRGRSSHLPQTMTLRHQSRALFVTGSRAEPARNGSAQGRGVLLDKLAHRLEEGLLNVQRDTEPGCGADTI